MKNQDEKITSMITDNTLPVDFVKNIGQPVSKLIINDVAVCERTDKFCTALNGCYHMKHKDAILKRVQVSQSRLQSQLTSVIVSQ